ncbi:MAG: hypothetical protein IPP71_08850 [Bacteroidetes bacterium]|nr:hypothetical protein [Bacteroidota bacterium]
MTNILKIFEEPFPLEEDPKAQLLSSLGISLFVIAFLFFFKPFGLHNTTLPLVKIVPVYVGYGLVTFLVSVMCDRLIRPAFPMLFNELEWNVAKNILWTVFVIMMIGFGNLFYSNVLGFTGISGSTLLMFQFYTAAIAIFPVTIITLLRRIAFLNRNLQEVKQINESITAPLARPFSETLLVFSSENLKDEIRITPVNFCLLNQQITTLILFTLKMEL